MSKQSGMDAQKVLEHQYITAETLYKTYIREANDVVKLPTRQMSPRKTQKLSGGSRMFRGGSALEGEVTDTAEFDTVTDEIRSCCCVIYCHSKFLWSKLLGYTT
jgi:hypothetical protein